MDQNNRKPGPFGPRQEFEKEGYQRMYMIQGEMISEDDLTELLANMAIEIVEDVRSSGTPGVYETPGTDFVCVGKTTEDLKGLLRALYRGNAAVRSDNVLFNLSQEGTPWYSDDVGIKGYEITRHSESEIEGKGWYLILSREKLPIISGILSEERLLEEYKNSIVRMYERNPVFARADFTGEKPDISIHRGTEEEPYNYKGTSEPEPAPEETDDDERGPFHMHTKRKYYN